MKKAFLYFIVFIVLSCVSDDENPTTLNESGISFNLNEIDYFLTDYNVSLYPADTNLRMIEATFDDDTKTLLFFVIVEETNQIEEFILIENGVQYSSDIIYGDRETSITTHTDTKMEGTFRVNIKDRSDNSLFNFTDGVIAIDF